MMFAKKWEISSYDSPLPERLARCMASFSLRAFLSAFVSCKIRCCSALASTCWSFKDGFALEYKSCKSTS
jgi:hypothetical protein